MSNQIFSDTYKKWNKQDKKSAFLVENIQYVENMVSISCMFDVTLHLPEASITHQMSGRMCKVPYLLSKDQWSSWNHFQKREMWWFWEGRWYLFKVPSSIHILIIFISTSLRSNFHSLSQSHTSEKSKRNFVLQALFHFHHLHYWNIIAMKSVMMIFAVLVSTILLGTNAAMTMPHAMTGSEILKNLPDASFVIDTAKGTRNVIEGTTFDVATPKDFPILNSTHVKAVVATSLVKAGTSVFKHKNTGASEVVFVVRGTFMVSIQLLDGGRLVTNIVKEGQFIVVPKDLVHTAICLYREDCKVNIFFNSANPGTIFLWIWTYKQGMLVLREFNSFLRPEINQNFF